MKNKIKISVVTIVKNDAVGFLATARSVLIQDYPNIEWIVIDGLSTDLTSMYVRQLGPQTKSYKIERDTGIYNAMNKGIDMVSGDWIFFLNADDVFYTYNTVSKYVNELRDCDDFIYADVERREDGLLHSYRPENQYWLGMSQDHQTVCGRSGIYKKMRFDETYSIAGDFEFFSRARNLRCCFRKIHGLIGCRKPFKKGASVDYVTRQYERLRVIRRYFSQYPYKEFIRNEYKQQLLANNITIHEHSKLMQSVGIRQ